MRVALEALDAPGRRAEDGERGAGLGGLRGVGEDRGGRGRGGDETQEEGTGGGVRGVAVGAAKWRDGPRQPIPRKRGRRRGEGRRGRREVRRAEDERARRDALFAPPWTLCSGTRPPFEASAPPCSAWCQRGTMWVDEAVGAKRMCGSAGGGKDSQRPGREGTGDPRLVAPRRERGAFAAGRGGRSRPARGSSRRARHLRGRASLLLTTVVLVQLLFREDLANFSPAPPPRACCIGRFLTRRFSVRSPPARPPPEPISAARDPLPEATVGGRAIGAGEEIKPPGPRRRAPPRPERLARQRPRARPSTALARRSIDAPLASSARRPPGLSARRSKTRVRR